jgi:hypothetical protein
MPKVAPNKKLAKPKEAYTENNYEEEKSLKNALVYELTEFFLNTSAHGFKNAYKTTSYVIRVIWIILIIASFSYISYCKFIELSKTQIL